MITINGTDIYLTRGDSAYMRLRIKQDNGLYYIPAETDRVRIQVRTEKNSKDPETLLFEGNMTVDEKGRIFWRIMPRTTTDLAIGTYYWDAQLEKGNGDVFTFIKPSLFNVVDEVTV